MLLPDSCYKLQYKLQLQYAVLHLSLCYVCSMSMTLSEYQNTMERTYKVWAGSDWDFFKGRNSRGHPRDHHGNQNHQLPSPKSLRVLVLYVAIARARRRDGRNFSESAYFCAYLPVQLKQVFHSVQWLGKFDHLPAP